MPVSNPKVSVCVQTYQQSKYIGRCLDSIIGQVTDFPYEIIIGEDESSDGTREICQRYAKQYKNIRLFLRSRKDTIYMFGRPTGRYNVTENFREARGKYIAICEGDDYWTNESKLQQQVDFLESNSWAVGCFHNSVCVDENDNIIESQYFKRTDKECYNQDEVLKELHSSYSTASLVFRTSAIKTRLEEFAKIGSDYILDVLISSDGDLCYLDENFSAYRVHPGGIWQGSTSLYNSKVQLARYKFLYSDSYFRKKYRPYLWRNIMMFHNRIISQSNDPKEINTYKNSRLRYLNFSHISTYTYILNKLFSELKKRIKNLF